VFCRRSAWRQRLKRRQGTDLAYRRRRVAAATPGYSLAPLIFSNRSTDRAVGGNWLPGESPHTEVLHGPSPELAGPLVFGGRVAEARQTEAQLRAEVETLRQQLAALVHDVRGPLGVILGYTEMLLKEARAQGRAEWVDTLERISRSALTVHSLVTNSVDRSRSAEE
jgi:signal transduction histidine kinase